MNKQLAQLAINGGDKAVTKPFNARGHFSADEKNACIRVLDEAISAGVAPIYNGKEEEALCLEFASLLGGGYADAVNSGTNAIFVALRALELEPFTEVIVPPITDVGGFSPVLMMNCIPIVADADKDSFNMGLEGVKRAYSERTSAILLAHIAGEPCDVKAICDFAQEKGIPVVEDCAQAHGALLDGKLLGTYGDISAFSLMYGKHVCMGGQGGLVFTKSEKLYYKVRQNADRGKPFGLESGSSNCVVALNANADEIHCAIGRVQIAKTMEVAERRRKIADKIFKGLVGHKALSKPVMSEGSEPSYWFLRILLNEDEITCSKAQFCEALGAEGLYANTHYGATPWQYDFYVKRRVFGTSGLPWSSQMYKGDKNKVFDETDLPNAVEALNRTFMIYPHESWDEQDVESCVNALSKVCRAYSR